MFRNLNNIRSQTQNVLRRDIQYRGQTVCVQQTTAINNLHTVSTKTSDNKNKNLIHLLAGVSGLAIVGSQYATRNFASAASPENTDKTTTMSTDYKKATSVYEFTVQDTYGKDVSLDQYKGHVLLIVNIASQCGLTKNNYKELTELKKQYHDKGLRILNFPCNQFGSQMPEGDGEAMVCHLRDANADIGDVFKKIDVNGSNTAPLYQYLKAVQGGTLGSSIKWNFTKFLVDKDGKPVNRYAPTTSPADIAKDIEKLF